MRYCNVEDFDKTKVDFYRDKRAIYSTKSADPYSKLCAYGRCVMVCYKK